MKQKHSESIVYRAVFEDLKPAHYKLNIPLPGRFEVEVYQDRGRWKARYARGGPIRQSARKGSVHPDFVQVEVALMFERQVEPWHKLQPAEASA